MGRKKSSSHREHACCMHLPERWSGITHAAAWSCRPNGALPSCLSHRGSSACLPQLGHEGILEASLNAVAFIKMHMCAWVALHRLRGCTKLQGVKRHTDHPDFWTGAGCKLKASPALSRQSLQQVPAHPLTVKHVPVQGWPCTSWRGCTKLRGSQTRLLPAIAHTWRRWMHRALSALTPCRPCSSLPAGTRCASRPLLRRCILP